MKLLLLIIWAQYTYTYISLKTADRAQAKMTSSTLHHYYCIICFVFIILYISNGAGIVRTHLGNILFVLHDAGESLGLQPVIDQLILDNLFENILILTLGSPSTSIFENYRESLTLSDVGVSIHVLDGEGGREQVLSPEDLALILQVIPAKTVVCGMAYKMQAQICKVSIRIGNILDILKFISPLRTLC